VERGRGCDVSFLPSVRRSRERKGGKTTREVRKGKRGKEKKEGESSSSFLSARLNQRVKKKKKKRLQCTRLAWGRWKKKKETGKAFLSTALLPAICVLDGKKRREKTDWEREGKKREREEGKKLTE